MKYVLTGSCADPSTYFCSAAGMAPSSPASSESVGMTYDQHDVGSVSITHVQHKCTLWLLAAALAAWTTLLLTTWRAANMHKGHIEVINVNDSLDSSKNCPTHNKRSKGPFFLLTAATFLNNASKPPRQSPANKTFTVLITEQLFRRYLDQ